ncbi:MAG: right-handed parallel beta-helix repeat-containing protein [Acidimicrobiia bacterium]
MLTRRQFIAQTAAAGSVVGLIASGLRLPARAQTPSQVLTGALAGFFVPPGQLWQLTGDVVLTADAIVEGTLLARAGTRVLTDGPQRRIWARNGGNLDFQGTPKTGWNRTGDDASWLPSDEMLVTPVAAGDFTTFASHTKGTLPPQASASLPRGEAFNLTRDLTFENVRLHIGTGTGNLPHHEGGPGGVQILKYLSIKDAGDSAIPGEYPIHFHLNGESSRGSVVEGVVVQGGRNHAFVPHGSHGITFRDCIAYQTFEDAFWWDPPPEENDSDPINNSEDIVWDHCLAAGVTGSSINIAGFLLGSGLRNTIRDSAAVGIANRQANASGFHWPSSSNHTDNVWVFESNIAHNNQNHGVFIWQNDHNPHVVQGLITYRNAKSGVEWGAYRNAYLFIGGLSYQDGEQAVMLHHSGRVAEENNQSPGMQGLVFDGGGVAPYNVNITRPNFDPLTVITFLDCAFLGAAVAPVLVNDGQEQRRASWHQVDFVNLGAGTDLHPQDFELVSIAAGTVIRIQRADGSADQLDDRGIWTPIAAFHQGASPAPPVTTTPPTVPGAPTTTTTTLGLDEHEQMQGLIDQAQEALTKRQVGVLEQALEELETILEAHTGG